MRVPPQNDEMAPLCHSRKETISREMYKVNDQARPQRRGNGKHYFGGFLLTDVRRPMTLLTFVMTVLSLRWVDRDFLRFS